MTLPFTIGGARAVIPGVYDTFRVADSLPAPVPAGRSVLVLGESEEGIPGSSLDLRKNFFTDYQSVLDFYARGPIVDAARMLFTAQPNPVFGGALQRLYVWKTNNTSRAQRAISSPANYGAIAAARYGEAGNLIKSQIVTATAEVLPNFVARFVPSVGARAYSVSVNGVVSAISLDAYDITDGDGSPNDFATKLNALSGVTVTGGASKTSITSAVTAALTATGEQLTMTASVGAFGTTLVAGDTMVIPVGSAFSGTGNANAGVYEVISASSSVVVAKRVKCWAGGVEANHGTFDLTGVAGALATDLGVYSVISVVVDTVNVAGSAASFEIAGASGAVFAVGDVLDYTELSDIISASGASVGSIFASVSAGKLTISLVDTSWSTVPAVGDLVVIESGKLQGATKLNIGAYVVTASTSQSVTLQSCYALSTEAVSSVALSGDTSPLKRASGVVSSSYAGRRVDSDSERQVKVLAYRVSDGESFSPDKIGGRTVLEVSFNGTASAASLSINAKGIMTVSFTGGPSTININTRKYRTMRELVEVINSNAGMNARVASITLSSKDPASLDQVQSLNILGAISSASYNGKIKDDYNAFRSFFDANFGLIAFAEGLMSYKAGLPAAEATSAFLAGGDVGYTEDSDVQAGFDAAMKIDVRVVVPCFSRDAIKDIDDSLTDSRSSYTIDSILAVVKSHVSTASTTLNKRERFGNISYYGSFENSKNAAATQSYERTQMTFQLFSATNSEGDIVVFLPWIAACALAAGRAQAVLGTSMLRKPFSFSDVKHIGDTSVYDDTQMLDFDPEDNAPGGKLEQAIEAGLATFRSVPGFGVRMESPDLSTRSRDNDPQGWVWERISVLYTCDEVREAVRSVLENFIGNRQTDTSPAVVGEAINTILKVFITNGSLSAASVDRVVNLGNGYRATVSVFPTEALEFMEIDVTARRAS